MIDKKKLWIFVFSGLGILMILLGSAAHKQGWFSTSQSFYTEFEHGDGVFVGTAVQILGLKVGQVEEVELSKNNKVKIKFSVKQKFLSHLKVDSKAQLGRPFIIGERIVTVVPGSPDAAALVAEATLQGEESLELLDLLSGGKISPYFATFSKLLDQMVLIIEGDKKGGGVNLVTLYKQAYTTLKSLESLGHDVGLIRKDFTNSPETLKLMSQLSASSEHLGSAIVQLDHSLPKMTQLGTDVHELLPEVNHALQETVLTLQALQKTFILRGAVETVKEERQKQAESRKPSSQSVDEKSKTNN